MVSAIQKAKLNGSIPAVPERSPTVTSVRKQTSRSKDAFAPPAATRKSANPSARIALPQPLLGKGVAITAQVRITAVDPSVWKRIPRPERIVVNANTPVVLKKLERATAGALDTGRTGFARELETATREGMLLGAGLNAKQTYHSLPNMPWPSELASVGYSEHQISALYELVASHDRLLDANHKIGVAVGVAGALGFEALALVPPSPIRSTARSASPPRFSMTAMQAEKKYKHAASLGITTTRGAEGFRQFQQTVTAFTKEEGVSAMRISYRGRPRLAYVRISDRVAVIATERNEFESAWKLTDDQFANIMNRGKL